MLPYLLPPTHYHSVSLSPPPEARTLAPAAWQPLVSLTQLLCCLTHSQHSPPPPSPPRQHQDGCSSINKQSASSFSSSPHSLPSAVYLAFLKMTPPKCDRNTTSLARRGNAASHRSWPVNAAAKVFSVQHSIILRAWFDDAFLIGAVRCGQIELDPLLIGFANASLLPGHGKGEDTGV